MIFFVKKEYICKNKIVINNKIKKTSMKKLNLFYLLTLLLVFASCSNSDDSKSETKLTVSVNDLILEAAAGSYSPVPLVITSSDDWKIVSHADWLDFSSKSGSAGTVSVTVRAKSINDSSQDRYGEFDVIAGDKVKTVEVRQFPALAAGCEVRPTDVVILTDGVAFDFYFGKKVSYYYYGYIDAVVAGSMTDDEIAYYAQEEFYRYTPEEGDLGYLSGLDSNTEYYLVTFGYDNKGNRGDMTKTLVKTKPIITNRPRVNISNVTYSSTEWNWNTTMSAYTSKYYMGVYSGYYASVISSMPDVWLAWYMKNEIESGEYSPILQSDSWNSERLSTDYYLYICAWAVGESNELAYELDTYYGSLLEDSPLLSRAANEEPKVGVVSKESIRESMKGFVIIEK